MRQLLHSSSLYSKKTNNLLLYQSATEILLWRIIYLLEDAWPMQKIMGEKTSNNTLLGVVFHAERLVQSTLCQDKMISVQGKLHIRLT